MNLFELIFWGVLLWLLFIASRWIGEVLGISTWVICPIVAVAVLTLMTLLGKRRRSARAEGSGQHEDGPNGSGR